MSVASAPRLLSREELVCNKSRLDCSESDFPYLPVTLIRMWLSRDVLAQEANTNRRQSLC